MQVHLAPNSHPPYGVEPDGRAKGHRRMTEAILAREDIYPVIQAFARSKQPDARQQLSGAISCLLSAYCSARRAGYSVKMVAPAGTDQKGHPAYEAAQLAVRQQQDFMSSGEAHMAFTLTELLCAPKDQGQLLVAYVLGLSNFVQAFGTKGPGWAVATTPPPPAPAPPAPPAVQVVLDRRPMRQVHKRNDAGDLVETVTTYDGPAPSQTYAEVQADARKSHESATKTMHTLKERRGGLL